MTTALTSTEIIQHTSAFLSEALSNPDLRHHILSAASLKIPASDQSTIRTIAIASDALENAISVANPAIRSSTLRLTKKLLLSSSLQNSLTSLLLSLIYSLCQRPTEASLCLLDVFLFDPSLARLEIAPSVFEDLFLLHLLPVLLWFKDQRSRILSSATPDRSSDGDDERSGEAEAGRRGMLSRMSGEQAAKLKGLEKDYEEVVDENLRNFARYFKEVLGDSGGIGTPSAPLLVLGTIGDGDAGSDAGSRRSRAGSEADGMNANKQFAMAKRRYNPIWNGGAQSIECDRSSASSISYQNMKSPTSYPTRVSSDLLSIQHSNRGSPLRNSSSDSVKLDRSSSSASSHRTAVSPPLYPLRASSSRTSKHYSSIRNSLLDNSSANSIEIDRSGCSNISYSSSSSPPLYPLRDSQSVFSKQNFDRGGRLLNLNSNSDSEASSPSANHFTDSSSESEQAKEEKNRDSSLFKPIGKTQLKQQKSPISAQSSGSADPLMADSDTAMAARRHTPPKDFICPITSNIFVDPVTLETGQTYERKAIQEWVDRGNSTCPITRQKLHSTQLPKTNYVLKRLIASWLEQNPGFVQAQRENLPSKSRPIPAPINPLTSPTSVISQATIDGAVGDLRVAIAHLCMSEILSESEMAVLRIEKLWREAKMESEVQAALSKPAVVNGFVEILFNSMDPQVLRSTVYLLSELASREKIVIQTLTRVESDLEGVIALFKNGLVEAVVLIYILKSSWLDHADMEMVDALLTVIKMPGEESLGMCLKPTTASVLILGQILRGIDGRNISMVARAVISERAIESIVGCLETEWVEERIAAVGILLRCMEEDGSCRNAIADKAELEPILECFVCVDDGDRFEIVHFLSELVKLNRRTFNEQLLHIIKDEGSFSTMHMLLIYLQTALQDQCPIIASLLLQLDLLAEPRKMSIYREEAVDALISCLRKSEFPVVQIMAAETIATLQGRFSSSGKPLTQAFLLKRAGFENSFRAATQLEKSSSIVGDFDENLEEEKAAEEWERKMAFVLVSHEFGLIFEALAEGIKSRSADLASACFVSATWLIYMLTILPDTGIRGAARVCLLKRFVSIFKSAKDTEDKALAMLALSSFMDDTEGLRDLSFYMKDILKTLRDLKKSSVLASKMIKIFSEGKNSSVELWNHKQLAQADSCVNGEVLSIICFKDKIFSGHTDGTIKVWSGKGSVLQLIQETRDHSKAVTSLAILQSGEKLYSGSIDKSIRAWAIRDEGIQCVQVHDVKDQVHNLNVTNSIACFIPQGNGVKVHSWNGDSKLLNVSKHVRCLTLTQGKLYCGCTDGSIQELDLATGTISTVQSGSRKLLGKAGPICAMQVNDGILYSGGTSLDGAAVKMWSVSNHSMVGSLPSTLEVRAMVISSELIYLGCKMGNVEIWSKESHCRVGALATRNNSRVLCLNVTEDGEVIVAGTSDGRIQAWGLS